MDDRLKFRVWDSEEKTYKSSDYPFFLCDDGDVLDTHFDVRNNDVVVEQCTELKDKNGKLIYEGDIVKTVLSDGSPFYHIIKWYDGKFVADYGWAYSEELEDYCSISQEWIGKKEVVGNIHENADLLKNPENFNVSGENVKGDNK